MARPDLSIALTINDECTTMELADTTDDYGGGTVTTAPVQGVVINVVNESTGTYFTYTFTVATNVITAATLSIDGGTATNILAELSSTAWPFITDVNEFDLWGDYGVTLPDFEDAVFEVDYTISRTSAEAYSYTTSQMKVRDCEICCCITDMFIEIDPTCNCSDSKITNALNAYAFLKSAIGAAKKGLTEKAVAALAKAEYLCECSGCSGC